MAISKSQDTNAIWPHQRKAYDTLERIARIAFSQNELNFGSLKFRTNTCLVGPSGVGKTHLANAVADLLSAPKLYTNVSTWTLLGASGKGSAHTWPTIHEFLIDSNCSDGAIIVLDEIDKIGDSSSWSGYLRTEIFDLLDRRIPRNLVDRDGDAVPSANISAAENVLRSKTLIVGVGAFQRFWDNSAASTGIGFVPTPGSDIPDSNDISKYIPRELGNRFGSNILVIPPMTKEHYHMVLTSILENLPDGIRGLYHNIAIASIDEAVRLQLGSRFFEEVLTRVLMHDSMAHYLEMPIAHELEPKTEPKIEHQMTQLPGNPFVF